MHHDVLIEPILSPSSQGCGVIPGVRSDTSLLSQLHCALRAQSDEVIILGGALANIDTGKRCYCTQRDPKQNMGLLIRIQMKCAYILWDQCRVQARIALGWMRGNEPITLAVHSAECCISKWPRVQSSD